MRTPSLEKNKSVLTNLINYERQSINEKAQITQGAFDSFVCGCTHAMDSRTNCSFNSQDNSWSGNQEHQNHSLTISFSMMTNWLKRR